MPETHAEDMNRVVLHRWLWIPFICASVWFRVLLQARSLVWKSQHWPWKWRTSFTVIFEVDVLNVYLAWIHRPVQDQIKLSHTVEARHESCFCPGSWKRSHLICKNFARVRCDVLFKKVSFGKLYCAESWSDSARVPPQRTRFCTFLFEPLSHTIQHPAFFRSLYVVGNSGSFTSDDHRISCEKLFLKSRSQHFSDDNHWLKAC